MGTGRTWPPSRKPASSPMSSSPRRPHCGHQAQAAQARRRGGFTLDDFTADEQASTVTCPNGITRRITDGIHLDSAVGWIFRQSPRWQFKQWYLRQPALRGLKTATLDTLR